METDDAKKAIMDQREKIIDDVRESILQLGKIIAGLQHIETGAGSTDSDLARIRNELDQSLEVAKQVKKRMQEIDQEIDTRDV